jgi:hypothetical protein
MCEGGAELGEERGSRGGGGQAEDQGLVDGERRSFPDRHDSQARVELELGPPMLAVHHLMDS